MDKLSDIIEMLTPLRRYNEVFYSFAEFREMIYSLDSFQISADEHILTPYYIYDNKIYEFYENELHIKIANVKPSDNYHYICIEGNNAVINSGKFLDYINFIYNSNNIQSTATKYFGSFCKANLYFAIY